MSTESFSSSAVTRHHTRREKEKERERCVLYTSEREALPKNESEGRKTFRKNRMLIFVTKVDIVNVKSDTYTS